MSDHNAETARCPRCLYGPATGDLIAPCGDHQPAGQALIAEVRALAYSEDAQAVLFGVTGTHPESYGGVTKDEALECAGEVLTRLRALIPPGTLTSHPVEATP